MSSSPETSTSQAPLYLIVDTSTKNCSIAVANTSGIIYSKLWETAYNPTSELLPNIMTALSHTDLTLNRIVGIGVAVGPGGFSSIRTGISVVKGIKMASGIPVIGFNTLDATAYHYIDNQNLITAVLAIGKGYFAWADYQIVNRSLKLIGNQKVGQETDLLTRKHTDTAYCGEGASILFGNVDASVRKDVHVLPYKAEDRINGLTQLVVCHFSKNPTISNLLEPIYLREPTIGKKNS